MRTTFRMASKRKSPRRAIPTDIGILDDLHDFSRPALRRVVELVLVKVRWLRLAQKRVAGFIAATFTQIGVDFSAEP